MFVSYVNELRKVKQCALNYYNKEDNLAGYGTTTFAVGVDLNTYTACGDIIDGVNCIGRDLQHIQSFG